jgi:hypothetical protein
MAWTVDKSKSYPRTVADPESGETAGVTFRKLTYGQIQKRRDIGIKRPKGSKDPRKIEWDASAVDMYTILTAIVEWEIPLPLTKESIAKLDPGVIKQINKHITEINPAVKNDHGFDDDDDDDEDEGEEEEEDYGIDEDEPAAEANGHAGEPEQVFAEEEGPTRLAASS